GAPPRRAAARRAVAGSGTGGFGAARRGDRRLAHARPDDRAGRAERILRRAAGRPFRRVAGWRGAGAWRQGGPRRSPIAGAGHDGVRSTMGKVLALKRRLRSPEQTEARILQAAEEVFGAKGYANATVADVVDLAQVSRGAFYLYFDNKDDVFKTLVARVIADLFEVTTRRSSGTIRNRVETSTRNYLEAFLRHRPVLRCLFEVSSSDAEMARMHN